MSNFDLKSWLIGFTLGLCGKPLPLPLAVKREPVAYLYNGVQLPALPEWDRESYPYAVIFDNSYTSFGSVITRYSLAFVKQQVYKTSSSSGKRYLVGQIGDISYEYRPSWDNWSSHSVATSTWFIGYVGGDDRPILWANFDIYNEDGTLYLSASEPIPVYE